MAASPLTDIESLRPVLAVRPLGLFSDIDGTLAPIVPRPEDARVTPRCRELLGRLIGAEVRVALITGRQLDVARSMVGLEGAAYAANHGLEFWLDGSTEWKAVSGLYWELVDQLAAYSKSLGDLGVTFEPKGQGVALHYRQAADESLAIAGIEDVIGSLPAASGFRRIDGRKVIELRPDMEASKGTAARQLAGQLGVKGIVCIGDDRTDVDMFRAVSALQRKGIEGRSVAVLSPEIAPELLEAADYSVEGVGGVEWLLAEVLRVVGETEP